LPSTADVKVVGQARRVDFESRIYRFLGRGSYSPFDPLSPPTVRGPTPRSAVSSLMGLDD